MKIYVIYFTRSNNSKRIAEKIANKLNAELVQITDGHNYKGLFGYIKAGFYSTSNKKVNIVTDKQIDQYDEIIIVSPIWAGRLANPIRKFLENIDLKNVRLVTASIGSTVKDLQGFKSIHSVVRNESNEEETISNVLEQISLK